MRARGIFLAGGTVAGATVSGVRTISLLSVFACVFAPAVTAAAPQLEPRLSLTTEERYDNALAGQGPGPQMMTKIIPRAGVSLRDRTLDSELWYSPDFQIRHTTNNEIRIDHRGGVDLAKRLTETADVSIRGQMWRVSDPTSLPRMGLGTAGFTGAVLYGVADAGLHVRLSERWSTQVRYRFEGARFFDPPPEQRPLGYVRPENSLVQAPAAEFWYRASARTSIGAEYRLQPFAFGASQALSHSPAGLLRFRVSRFTTLMVRGGPVWFAGQKADVNSTEVLYVTGVVPRLHFELTRDAGHFDFGGQLGQDLAGANGYTTAQWAQYAGFYTGWRITRPLRVHAGSYLFRSGAAPGGLQEWTGTQLDALGYAVEGGAEWEFHPQLRLQLSLQRVDQLGVVAFTRNIAAVRLMATAW